MAQKYHYVSCIKCGIKYLQGKFVQSRLVCRDCYKKELKVRGKHDAVKYVTPDKYADAVLKSINPDKRKDIY